jgi:hypothetical protein
VLLAGGLPLFWGACILALLWRARRRMPQQPRVAGQQRPPDPEAVPHQAVTGHKAVRYLDGRRGYPEADEYAWPLPSQILGDELAVLRELKRER